MMVDLKEKTSSLMYAANLDQLPAGDVVTFVPGFLLDIVALRHPD